MKHWVGLNNIIFLKGVHAKKKIKFKEVSLINEL